MTTPAAAVARARHRINNRLVTLYYRARDLDADCRQALNDIADDVVRIQSQARSLGFDPVAGLGEDEVHAPPAAGGVEVGERVGVEDGHVHGAPTQTRD